MSFFLNRAKISATFTRMKVWRTFGVINWPLDKIRNSELRSRGSGSIRIIRILNTGILSKIHRNSYGHLHVKVGSVSVISWNPGSGTIIQDYGSSIFGQCGSCYVSGSWSRDLITKNGRNYSQNKLKIFWSKTAFDLSHGFHNGRLSYRRILQVSKKNTSTLKHEISSLFSIFVGHLCTSRSRSGSSQLKQMRIHAGPDPDPQHGLRMNFSS